jgi:membrane-bound inhibitor of C-type lysozyme
MSVKTVGAAIVLLMSSVFAAHAQTAPPEQRSRTYAYRCGELEVVGTFTIDTLALRVGDRTLELPQAQSGSGARYADTEGNEFWGKGLRDAMLTLAGSPMRHCHGDGKERPAPSPIP